MLRADTQQLRDVLVHLPLFPEADYLVPKRLPDLLLQLASINLFHGKNIAYCGTVFHYLVAVVITYYYVAFRR